MKKVVISCVIFVLVLIGGLWFISSQTAIVRTQISHQTQRQIDHISLDTNQTNKAVSVAANKLPEFTLDITAQKFNRLLTTSKEQLKNFVQATIVHESYAAEKPDAEIRINEEKHQLIIHPQDIPNFKPGKYKLSLQLRTLEGVVTVEQDFTWGVIAVNTNKSLYKPGEAAKIGIGVLNDKGETQCLAGFNHVDAVTMTITDPQRNATNFSLADKTIADSGKCGPITVTNEADFQAKYTTTTAGIYQMKVSAIVKGEKREIEDYFKVDENIPFDVERTSFPTRIYPRAPYPVTFTVNATQDYQGTVTDIVPANFAIEHISDNGHLEKDGDFTRIIWDTNSKAGTAKTFTYFITFPLVSPEFYLLGPIQIGSFKEARQWQIASDAINSTSGLVSYEDNGGNNTWSRIWTGTTWNPALGSAATSMSTTPSDSRWFREVSSPKTGEKIVALLDNISPDTIYVFTWSGTAWSLSLTIPLTGVTTADVTRPFDVAYEELSGDALFVYSDYSTNQLKYYKRVGGTWDSSASNAGTGFDVFKRWVKLKPQFQSDSILVGYVNNNNRIGAMIWNGATNAFGNQFTDASGTTAATSANAAFDIAWETQSGIPMIFWGTTNNDILYRRFTAGTWQTETSGITGFTNDIDWLFASADPRSTSNYIAIATQELVTPACRSSIWTGSTLTRNGNSVQCTSATTNNLIDTAFENNTGKAMWTLAVSTASAQLSWLTWTDTAGFSALRTEAGSSSTIEGMQLYSDLNTTSMIVLYHDDNGTQCALWDREWDGTSWSTKNANSIHANLCASADNDTEPYGFGFDRNLETLVAYRWFNNPGPVTTDVGTPLTTQDTPYTLTTANQAFRLRLLLYTSDTIAASLRNYKLQFVDPGTGTCSSPIGGTPSTWTDVPTTGSQISLNDLAPADGANLISNVNDPTYFSKTKVTQTYKESNPFTNSTAQINGDQVGEWDFSLLDNTTYDRTAQAFCFRVARSNDLVLQIGKYPQINTAAISDVKIQGGSRIQGGTKLQ